MTQEALDMAAAIYVALVAVGFTRWMVGVAQRAYLLSTMKATRGPAPDLKKKGGDRAAGS